MIHMCLFSPSLVYIINYSSNKSIQCDINKKRRNIIHYNSDSNIFIASIPGNSLLIPAKQKHIFTTYLGHVFIVKTYPLITLFKHHINLLPNSKQYLISSYSEDHRYTLLAEVIQNRDNIIIATDGSKRRKAPSGDWVITDSKDNIIVEGHNPDFVNIKRIHSHRSDIFGVLSIFVFVNKYCKTSC